MPLFIVALVAARTIKDNSFLWHIRAGSVQLAQQHVLNTDAFSFTQQGVAWRTQSWVVELLYATLEANISGLSWVNWMVFIVGVAIAGFLGISVYHSVASPIVTSMVLIVAVWLIGPFLQPRPVIYSYLLLAALVVVFQHKRQLLWMIVPIIWIWAGIHGSWVIGGLLIGLEWLRCRDVKLFYAGTLALIATVATAHGLGTWQILLDFLGSRDALALMEEWKSPDFGDVVQGPYFLIIAGVIVAAIRGKLDMRDLIVILPFMLFGMTSRRAVVPAVIVLTPWAAYAVAGLKPSGATVRRGVVIGIGAVLSLIIVLPLLLGKLGVLYPDRFPESKITDALPSGDVFQGDAVGGYLIYSEWPDRLVFVDDRAELYGYDVFAENQRAREGDYRALFDRLHLEGALVRQEWPLRRVLQEDGWELKVEDEFFAVFVRP